MFCSEESIKEYNIKYLSHNYETDIITFYDTDDKGRLESDIIISPDMVKHNSKRFRKDFSEELFRVVLHGLLHLCGFDDKEPKKQKQMRKMEDHYLQKVGILELNA